MPRSHTTSNYGVLGLVRKLRRYTFQWNWSHVQILWELTGIVKTIRRPKSVLLLRCHFWADGLCIELESIRNASLDSAMTPSIYIQ
jgi:hypothetical protein